MITINGKYTSADVMIDDIEENCYKQIVQFVNNVAFTKPVKIMPDCHAGKGSCIGFTMQVVDKLNPEIIGTDIGCGMISIKLPKDVDVSNLKSIDDKIRREIPLGTSVCQTDANFKERMDWDKISDTLQRNLSYSGYFNEDDFNKICEKFGCNVDRIKKSIGSLGGGNHFIELGKDEEGNIWLTIHTGSRNLGKQVMEYHTNIAKTVVKHKQNGKYLKGLAYIKKHVSKLEIQSELKKLKDEFGRNDSRNNEVYFLEGDYLTDYLEDMVVAQHYADINRRSIGQVILSNAFGLDGHTIARLETVESVHNYLDFEDNIIRKGAIASYKGQKVVIPWNMRDGLIIGEGKSNADWNYSAPHGAGRLKSRSAAKKSISLETFKDQMKGIYSSSVNTATLDEAPDAYKDFEVVKNAIGPTVKILHTVKPILNIKA